VNLKVEIVLKDLNYPFNLNKRRTKSLLVDPTIPFFLIALFRFVDFFVKMCLLKAFWKLISPVPVTLKRFFALELVFTFGINNNLIDYSLLAVLHGRDTC